MKKIFTYSMLAIAAIFMINASLHAGTIHSTIYGGEWNTGTTWVGGIGPGENDTAVINGPVIVGHVEGYEKYHSYGGWVIVEQGGSLRPPVYGGGLGTFILHVAHDFTNHGTIHCGTVPDDYEFLQLNINGNIYDDGSWRPEKTLLTGNDQHISQGQGSVFGGVWECTAPCDIHADSDLKFDCIFYNNNTNVMDFNLGGSTLHMGNHALDATGTLIYNGTIEGNFSIKGRFAVNKSPSDTLKFIGNITVTDTLENNEYGGGLGIQNLMIEGNLTNNGVIRDDDDMKNDDRLSILITGDIVNNGKWTCYYVNLVGNQEQSITQVNGMVFDSYFADLDSSSSVRANSNITILQDFDLGKASLDMKGNSIMMKGWLHNGVLDNAQLHGGYLQYLDCINGISLHGMVIVDDSVSFDGPLTVNDTLMPNSYGGGAKHYHLPVNGDLINHGVIMNNNGGESLFLYISGNITNNGEWINYLTHVYVSNEQFIELIDDKPIESIMEFDAVVQSETYQWYYDDAILDSEDFDGETSKVLRWLVPVSSEWYGSFYCETGTKESVGILIKKGNLGIEGPMQEIDFAVYPNPCRDKISIRQSAPGSNVIPSGVEGQNSKLEIVDLNGRVFYESGNQRIRESGSQGVRESEMFVDVSRLPAGLYLVKLQTEAGLGVRKFIKR